MKYLNILIILLVASSTLSFIKNNDSQHKGTMIVEAKVIEKPFVNKVGKESSFSELYIEVKQHTYFVKWTESKISPDELKPYINSKVRLKIDIRDGLWDTDDPNVQSRVGEYVAILKLFNTESE